MIPIAFVLLLLSALLSAAPAGAQESIAWTDVTNADVDENGNLTKTSSCQGCPDSGARSQQEIASGDGYFQFTIQENSIERDIGLSNGSLATAEEDIAYAWVISSGIAEVREYNAYRTDTTIVPGDVLMIAVDGDQVYFYKNSQLIYTSSVAPTYPLAVHALLLGVNASITNAMFGTPDILAAAPAATIGTAWMPPPMDRTKYDYNSYKPGSTGFVAKGSTFVDPVHKSTIRRLTNEFPGHSGSDIYGKNGFWNSNGTRMYHRTEGQERIIDTTTGAVVVAESSAGFPGGTFPGDGSFAPDNANLWYYFANPEATNLDCFGNPVAPRLRSCLMSYTLPTQNAPNGTKRLIKQFWDVQLRTLGGSIDWVDRSGRYMVLNVGGTLKVWDNTAKVLFAGGIPETIGSGWAGITPDGKYVVQTGAGWDKWSYPINHSTRSVNAATGVMFWNLCGGHGDFVSTKNPNGTDGLTYWVGFECTADAGIYRVDITRDQRGRTDAQQRAANLRLFPLAWDDQGHVAGGANGVYQNWAYVSIESNDDLFDVYGTWTRPYKMELVMVNVETSEIRRLAHHRSRQLMNPDESENYYYQPRVSSSWDGTRIAWASNFNYKNPNHPVTQYADIYSIRHMLTATFLKPAAGQTVSGTTPVAMSLKGSMAPSWTYTLTVDGATVSTGTLQRPTAGTTYSWPTTSVSNGQHTLKLTVTDADGLTASTTRTVTVAN